MKGSNMKHSVKWWNGNDNCWSVWRRKGNVIFNLVRVEPNVRRSSISSTHSVSTGSIIAHSIGTPVLVSDDNSMLHRSELLQHTSPVFLNQSSLGQLGHYPYVPPDSQTSSKNVDFATPSDQQQEEIFELIKSWCLKNPMLFRKVAEWGSRTNRARRFTQEETEKLSKSRLWLIAHIVDVGEDEVSMDSLDDIKGAYQEISPEVWKQPDPHACGSDVQHKLFKNQHGRWMIERYDLKSEEWHIRAKELDNGHWIDIKNNKMIIQVYRVPMVKILEKLDEDLSESKTSIQKSIDFLFTSCNQLKLAKLKGRNLKHHIANLKVKLDKRYALSLGVRLANTAEAVTQE